MHDTDRLFEGTFLCSHFPIEVASKVKPQYRCRSLTRPAVVSILITRVRLDDAAIQSGFVDPYRWFTSMYAQLIMLFTPLVVIYVVLPYWLAVRRYTHRTKTNHIYGWHTLCVFAWIIKSHIRKYGMPLSKCRLYYGFSE